MSTAAADTPAVVGDSDTRKVAAAALLGLVLGEGVMVALRVGFSKGGDFAGVVPLLVGAGAKPHLASATRAALATADGARAREASAAALLDLVLGEGVMTALRLGFSKGGDFANVVPLLVGAAAKPHLEAATRAALALACDAGQAGVAALLLAVDGVGHFFWAEDNDWKSSYVDDDGRGGYSLLAASAARGDADVVRVLIDSGMACINREDDGSPFAPLERAAHGGHAACVALLLAAGRCNTVNEESNGVTALMAAATHGHTECVAALVAASSIYLDTRSGMPAHDCRGTTALQLAAEKGHGACVAVLLGAGCNVNQTDRAGDTALMCAAQAGQRDVVRALLAAGGIRVNHTGSSGWTALLCAASGNHVPCVRTLLATKGIDHGVRSSRLGDDRETLAANHYGAGGRRETALHAACHRKNAEMVSILLTAGSCRFALCKAADGYHIPHTVSPLAMAEEDAKVRAVFLSGVDYWQRSLHGGHSWAMRQVVRTLLLVCQRLGAIVQAANAVPRHGTSMGEDLFARLRSFAAQRALERALVDLPEEIWLLVCGFLRSADFPPR